MEFDAVDDDGLLTVTGRLRDRRPWATGTEQVDELHDITLRITVDRASLAIVAARVQMDRFPHAECPAIAPAFQGLVGLNVSRGYTRAVQERFGGAAGCTHVDQLARSIGPVVIQAVTSLRSRDRDWGETEPGSEAPAPVSSAFPRNTCHVWRDDGPGERKLAAGWRPGIDGYPAPPLEQYLPTPRSRSEGER
jgi:Protein of unknown function (DUF2889)